MPQRTVPRNLILSLLIMALAACGGAPTEEAATPAEPETLSNEALDLVLTDPATAGFELEANGGSDLRLRWPGDGSLPPATYTFAVGPDVYSVNLVEEIKSQKEEMNSRPDGEFKGQVELGSHLGPAYLTRGRFSDDGVTMEEHRLFAKHPRADRLLTLTAVYPPTEGDTQARREQIMTAYGLITFDGTGSNFGEGGGDATEDEGTVDGGELEDDSGASNG
ncbi:MAG: hypothetical protein AAF481_09290 [Acidobacteriota bacterium]